MPVENVSSGIEVLDWMNVMASSWRWRRCVSLFSILLDVFSDGLTCGVACCWGLDGGNMFRISARIPPLLASSSSSSSPFSLTVDELPENCRGVVVVHVRSYQSM